MNQNDNILNEIKEIAPILAAIKTENPFKVPNNYFENLPQIIQSKCIKEKTIKVNSWDLIIQRLFQPRVAVSLIMATLVLSIGIYIYKTSIDQSVSLSKPVAEISSSEASEFIDENINEFDDDLITEVYCTDKDVQKAEEEDEIQDYILNNIDEETIKEELL